MISYLSKVPASRLTGRAVVRVDFNTKDAWRMEAVLPTLAHLKQYAEKTILLSHYGRPDGQVSSLSLRRQSALLTRKTGRSVVFVPYRKDIGESVALASKARKKSLVLLENIRFWSQEEANVASFAKQLATLGDYFVNDAFAVSHRACASVVGITAHLPSYAGLLLEKELIHLRAVVEDPAHPFVVIIGGAKAADKLPVMKKLKNVADSFLLAGAAANTILFLQGDAVKKSLRDTDEASLKQIGSLLRYKNVVMPVDYRWGGDAIYDVGPKTADMFAARVAAAKTILWSGPLGLTEKPEFAESSLVVARAIVKNTQAISITGGGETVQFLKQYKLDKHFSFISTGGSAMLEFLSGKKLPGIAALENHRIKN